MKKLKLFAILFTLFSMTIVGCDDLNEPSDGGDNNPVTHTHTFSSEWEYDKTHHWHKATCGHDVIDSKEEHNFGEWTTVLAPTEEETGYKTRSCTVCDYFETEIIPAVTHTHTFASTWSYDKTYHWHEATCGHDIVSDKTEHTYGDWVIDIEATSTSEGKKHRDCEVCDYSQTEKIERVVDEPTGLVKGKSLSEVFNDASGNYKKVFEITGVIASWRSGKDNATMYGNFLIKETDTSETTYVVYGSTASQSALSYDEGNDEYVFSNPTDFLTNDITKDIAIGDTVKMWVTRNDHETYGKQICGIIVSVTPKSISPVEGTFTVDIYASNDIHGQINEESGRMNIATYGTFMKEKGEFENTLTLDQGDSWQGSIYSNYNHGQLVNDIMSIAKIDARTVGNHDFDWGLNCIKANTARSYNGYKVPVLAANVYDYNFSTKTEGTTQQEDIGQKTITYTLDNGLKVGIVGVIGENQITSISSNYVQDIYFKDHISVIKEEATNLRNDGCDIVIATVHAEQEDVMGNSLSNYVDLVLCGHSHEYETANEGDLYYAQFSSNNQYIGHIQLTYDASSQKVTNTSIEPLSKNQVSNSITSLDSDMVNLVKTYSDECDTEANTVVASNADYFDKNELAVNLMCEAMMDEVKNEGYNDVILSYCNQARHYLSSGSWTYADLYSAFPFDNTVYIVSVKGSDILNQVKKNNNVCFADGFDKQIKSNQYYQIACLDYLLYHTNTSRYYNYFPSFDGTTVGHLNNNYRVILKNYLIDNSYNTGKHLSSDNYSSSLDKFNRSLLTSV